MKKQILIVVLLTSIPLHVLSSDQSSRSNINYDKPNLPNLSSPPTTPPVSTSRDSNSSRGNTSNPPISTNTTNTQHNTDIESDDEGNNGGTTNPNLEQDHQQQINALLKSLSTTTVTDNGILQGASILAGSNIERANARKEHTNRKFPQDTRTGFQKFSNDVTSEFVRGVGQGFGQTIGQTTATILLAKATDLVPALKSEMQRSQEGLDQRFKDAQTKGKELEYDIACVKKNIEEAQTNSVALQQLVNHMRDVNNAIEAQHKACGCKNASCEQCKTSEKEHEESSKISLALYKVQEKHNARFMKFLQTNRREYLVSELYKQRRNETGEQLPLDEYGNPTVDRFGNPVRYGSFTNNKRRILVNKDGYPLTEDNSLCPVDHDGKLLMDEKGNPLVKEITEKNSVHTPEVKHTESTHTENTSKSLDGKHLIPAA